MRQDDGEPDGRPARTSCDLVSCALLERTDLGADRPRPLRDVHREAGPGSRHRDRGRGKLVVRLRHRPCAAPRQWKAARPKARDAPPSEQGLRPKHSPDDANASCSDFNFREASLPRRRTGRLSGRGDGLARFESASQRLSEPEAGAQGFASNGRGPAPGLGDVPRGSAPPADPPYLRRSQAGDDRIRKATRIDRRQGAPRRGVEELHQAANGAKTRQDDACHASRTRDKALGVGPDLHSAAVSTAREALEVCPGALLEALDARHAGPRAPARRLIL